MRIPKVRYAVARQCLTVDFQYVSGHNGQLTAALLSHLHAIVRNRASHSTMPPFLFALSRPAYRSKQCFYRGISGPLNQIGPIRIRGVLSLTSRAFKANSAVRPVAYCGLGIHEHQTNSLTHLLGLRMDSIWQSLIKLMVYIFSLFHRESLGCKVFGKSKHVLN